MELTAQSQHHSAKSCFGWKAVIIVNNFHNCFTEYFTQVMSRELHVHLCVMVGRDVEASIKSHAFVEMLPSYIGTT